MRKKIVLNILSSNSLSGAENVVCDICEKMGEEYDIYYCSPGGEIEKQIANKDINYIKLSKLNFLSIKKVIKSLKPDVIIGHDFKASFLVSMFGARKVSYLHKNDPKMKVISFKSILYLLVNFRFDCVVGVSKSILSEYKFKNFLKRKFLQIENIVDYNKIQKKATEENKYNNYDICYVGRIVEEKNSNFMMEIFLDLIKLMPNLKIAIAGTGPLLKSIQKIASDNNVSNNIEFMGFIDNPYELMLKSKTTILPSRFEGFGLVAIESLALGTPVFNSGVGGLKTIFNDNLSYYICESKEDYVNKIYNYIINGEKKVYKSYIYKYLDIDEWKRKLRSAFGD